ncbi:MAG: glycine--tRNA ligase subunit beta [Alphaproteobacteria bacterium]|nr:glycine--tRNA ligase subunit beta [Alphaproteobacteria bacterium]
MAELLIELFSEEIPARMQARAAADLEKDLASRLTDQGLAFTDARTYVTPRRIAVVFDGVPERQEDVREEKRGPRVGAPEKALEGFLKGNGVAKDQLEERDTGKGVFYFAVVETKGRDTREILPALLTDAIEAFGWPKSMRWATHGFRWVRPLRSILCLFDGKKVDGALSLGDAEIPFGDTTEGHRFLAPGRFQVTSFADYAEKLRAAKVVLDPAERRALIQDGAAALAADKGLLLKADPGLLTEVTGLVEWPVPLLGTIDAAFMDVPPEVLTTSMREHQKYFALETADGRLAPHFVVVANMETADNGATILAGNEKVLRARLSDAKFFWDQDRAQALETRLGALDVITFHEKLGTLREKVERVRLLARGLAEATGADPVKADRAAELAKADLTTGMVGEFPELQGLMGRYYALNDGQDPDVADAIADHYAPQGPSDACPSKPVSVAVALADKLDTLVGFFAIDEKPTGSRDPFALRRAALGIIRLMVENGVRLSLATAIENAWDKLDITGKAARDKVTGEVIAFIGDRLKVAMRDKGVRHDLIAAVMSQGGVDDLVLVLKRVDALQAFLAGEAGANLLTAYKRAANILRIEGEKTPDAMGAALAPGLFDQDEEKALGRALAEARGEIAAALEEEDFSGAMSIFAGLRSPVDAFFDEVKVNADEAVIRANRLALLSELVRTMQQIAEFSVIEG